MIAAGGAANGCAADAVIGAVAGLADAVDGLAGGWPAVAGFAAAVVGTVVVPAIAAMGAIAAPCWAADMVAAGAEAVGLAAVGWDDAVCGVALVGCCAAGSSGVCDWLCVRCWVGIAAVACGRCVALSHSAALVVAGGSRLSHNWSTDSGVRAGATPGPDAVTVLAGAAAAATAAVGVASAAAALAVATGAGAMGWAGGVMLAGVAFWPTAVIAGVWRPVGSAAAAVVADVARCGAVPGTSCADAGGAGAG